MNEKVGRFAFQREGEKDLIDYRGHKNKSA